MEINIEIASEILFEEEEHSIFVFINSIKSLTRIVLLVQMKIQELTVYTNHLSEQRQFYLGILGLDILNESNHSILFNIGNSNLRFVKREKNTPYHFAFNIPSNKEEEALLWLKQRVEVLKMDGNEIQDFDDWNAKAIYFYDVDKNIVEFIARKNLNNKSTEKFNHSSLLEISEIGIPTVDIKNEYTFLNRELGLDIYDGTFSVFCAIGSETGLFICINKNQKGWFPLNDKAYSSDFKLKLSTEKGPFEMGYLNEKIEIIAKSGS